MIKQLLIIGLFVDALAVFGMQLHRWRGAWVFVALYWLILTIKNYLDLGGKKQ